MLVLCFCIGTAKNDGSGCRMNILAVLIGFHHRLVPAVECSHTQFDLRKIERQDQMIFRSLNKIADTDGIVAFSGAVL